MRYAVANTPYVSFQKSSSSPIFQNYQHYFPSQITTNLASHNFVRSHSEKRWCFQPLNYDHRIVILTLPGFTQVIFRCRRVTNTQSLPLSTSDTEGLKKILPMY